MFTFATATLYSVNLWLLFRHGDKRLPVRLVEIVLITRTVIVLWRTVSIPWNLTADDVFQQTATQLLYIGSFVITHFFLLVGAVLMATNRLVGELKSLAQNDPLTRLPNRRTLFERMENQIARTRHGGRGPAILMFDLDHFKNVNDTQGHQHGDQVLVHFADILRAQLRKTDHVGRYGGEEFMVMLTETDQAAALQIARRIHDATDNGHALNNPVSIGIATWNGSQNTLTALIARADNAVYEAKAQGRNRICTV